MVRSLVEHQSNSVPHGRRRLLHHGKPTEVSQGPVRRVAVPRSVPVQGPARVPLHGRRLWDVAFPRRFGHGLAGLGSAGPAQHASQHVALQQHFTHRFPPAPVPRRPRAVHQPVRGALLPQLAHHHRRGAVESLRERPQLQAGRTERQNERRICRSFR